MAGLRQLLGRLIARLRRNQLDQELAEEMALHIELRRDALIADGMDPREAAYEARRLFGNATAIREETREMWGFFSIDSLTQDIRYGVRLLRRSPTFTLIAGLSLATGIGASAAVFSLADAVLFQKLPVRDPDDLVLFRWISGRVLPFDSLSGYGSQDENENSSTSFSFVAFKAAQEQGARHADVIGFADLYRLNIGIGGEAELGTGQSVSGNYFDVLDVSPAAGRPITAQDDEPSTAAVAMLAYPMWQRRFGGSPDVIGRTITINSIPVTIVGVTPRGFRGTLQVGNDPALFVPLALQPRLERSTPHGDPNVWWVLLMARLKPGVSTATARPVFDAIIKQNIAAHRAGLAPKDLPRIELQPGNRGQLEDRTMTRQPLLVMAAVVAIVLIVACANVANLLLARASARNREVSVRVALGAPRLRIVRQLLTESLVLASIASAVGLLVASTLARGLLPALDQSGTFAVDVTLNPLAVLFTIALAVASTVLFGVLPAVRGTNVSPSTSLHTAGRGHVGGARRIGPAGALVAVQVALSLLLVTGAGLLAGSVRNLERLQPGFDPSNILLFRIDPTLNGYEGELLRAVYTALLERMRALPGVRSASLSSHTLIANSSSISEVFLASSSGDPQPLLPGTAAANSPTQRAPLAWRQNIDDQFFQTFGIPVRQGRVFSAGESPTGQPVAIVNEKFARSLLKTAEPIGRRFRLSRRDGAPEFEVIGVVADAKYMSLRYDVPATVYLSYLQQPPGAMTFEVKSVGDPLGVVTAVRAAVRDLDPNVPLFDVRTQADQIHDSLRKERLFARLATTLGAVTLLLAGIGVYGLMAAFVTRRTSEIGIRMALGAERSAVKWMVLRQSLVLVAAGMALGVPAALMGNRIMETLLFGLTPSDPRVLSTAALILAAVSVIAAYVPARRAAGVDPLIALRHE